MSPKRPLPEVPRLLLGVSSLDQPVRTDSTTRATRVARGTESASDAAGSPASDLRYPSAIAEASPPSKRALPGSLAATTRPWSPGMSISSASSETMTRPSPPEPSMTIAAHG